MVLKLLGLSKPLKATEKGQPHDNVLKRILVHTKGSAPVVELGARERRIEEKKSLVTLRLTPG